jgi:hypothetical protein
MPYSHLSGAVLSGESMSDHEYQMAQKEVAVRDGDDAILIGNDETLTDGDEHISISLNTETGEVAGEEEGSEGDESGSEEGAGNPDVPEFQDNVDPVNMQEASALVIEAEAGQNDVMQKALDGGVTQEQLDAMHTEFDANGKLSDESYATLEAAGLSKAFISSFMAGQTAVGEKFANSVLDYVGGKANFEKLAAFMGEAHGDMADAFNSAMERFDVVTIKALLDSGKTLMRQQYGVRPTRTLTAATKPAVKPTTTEVVGFESRAEMVKAMGDKRYSRDAAYRREVEQKVINSKF